MKEKFKILLSTLKTRSFSSYHVPLALLYLKAFALKDKKIRNKADFIVREDDVTESDDSILKNILRTKPNIVGFSCYTWNTHKIIGISEKLKKSSGDIKIILGGPQVSPIAEDILRSSDCVDIIVRGEGEVTFRELVKKLTSKRKDIENIEGITYRHNGSIIRTKDRPPLKSLDSIPSVFHKRTSDFENKRVCIETQRGCVFKCDFCYYHKSFEGIRYFSLKRVKKDLGFLLRQKIERIYLMDPVFNINPNRAKRILRFIIANNKNNIKFNTELRAELIDDEMAMLLARANFDQLEIGLQSTNKTVLKSVNRKLNFKNFERGVGLLKHYKVPIEIQLIFGLPNDTLNSFLESVDKTVPLKPDKLSLFPLSVLPGTEIWKNVSKYGIRFQDAPNNYFKHSDSIPPGDVHKFFTLQAWLCDFRKLWIMDLLSKDLDLKFSQIVVRWVNWLPSRKDLTKSALSQQMRAFLKHLEHTEKKSIDENLYENLIRKELEPMRIASDK